MNSPIPLWPAQASTHAANIDALIAAFTVLILLLAGPVFVLIFVFAVRYRRGKEVNREHAPNRNMWIEVSWSAIPFFAVLGFYVWATRLYFDLNRPPPNTLNIDIVAKQWMWKAQHPGGQGEIDELHVPVGEPVKLVMTSQDVIHSFYVPALRIKRDVLPGRYTTMWFTASKPGVYWLTCAEFCGTDHSVMGGKFYVMTPQDYAKWLGQSDVDQTLAAQGEILFRHYGCSGCHGPASSVKAPPLAGLYGRPVPLASGEVVTADEQYIHDSILFPHRQVAAGYKPIMPTFRNVLSESDVLKLVAYIKSLKPVAWRRE
jgi:cytochrome c oxidase subunit II